MPGLLSRLPNIELVISSARPIVRFFQWEKRLIGRFIATSFVRAAASMAVVLLIKDFLSGALGGKGGGGVTIAGQEPSWLVSQLAATVGPDSTLWALAGMLLFAYVGGALMAYDNQVSQQRIMKVLELGLMERLIRHLLKLSVPFFDRAAQGDIIQAVRQDITQLRTVVMSVAAVFLEGVLAVGLVIAAFKLSPWLTLWGLFVLPIAFFPILLLARRTLARSYTVRKAGYVLFDVVIQLLNGIRVIKAYGLERKQAELSVQKGRVYFDQIIEMVRVRSMSTVVLESMAGLGIVVVIVIGGLQIQNGTLAWPALMAFVMTMRALQGPLNNVHTHFVQIQTYGASVHRIAELLGVTPEVVNRKDAVPLAAAPREIAFDRVGFRYAEKPVIEDLSFKVAEGSTIGIVGPSGAGKTTILNLIVRFYDPTSGAVRFDGRDLRDFKLDDVYKKIAIVMQEPFLFAASVRENIRCARPGATDADVEAAARAAYIHEEILALPEGYETPVGPSGHGLSGGQRQRINVARALLKNAPILLLDEATSALDSVAEAEVQRAIDRLMQGRTCFVIAHRLSTLRNADKILVMDKGRCVGFDSHEQLLQDCAVYRKVWETQNVGERMQRSGAAA